MLRVSLSGKLALELRDKSLAFAVTGKCIFVQKDAKYAKEEPSRDGIESIAGPTANVLPLLCVLLRPLRTKNLCSIAAISKSRAGKLAERRRRLVHGLQLRGNDRRRPVRRHRHWPRVRGSAAPVGEPEMGSSDVDQAHRDAALFERADPARAGMRGARPCSGSTGTRRGLLLCSINSHIERSSASPNGRL